MRREYLPAFCRTYAQDIPDPSREGSLIQAISSARRGQTDPPSPATLCWLLLLCAALLSSACATQQPPLKPQQLQGILARQVDQGFSGQVLVAQGDGVLLHETAAGQADPKRLIYPLNSLSKPLMAALWLRQQSLGQADLEQSIRHWLDELEPEFDEVLIRHLLAHASGLPAEIHHRGYSGNPLFEAIERDRLIQRVNRVGLSARPGARFIYSNVGYNLLAAALEQAHGVPWHQSLDRDLLAPAGIKQGFRPALHWPNESLARGSQAGDDRGHFGERPGLADGSGWNLRGAGDLHASSEQLLTLWHALRQGQLLDQQEMQQWLRPRHADGRLDHYALGWSIRQTRRGTRVHHSGQNGAFSNEWRWYPQQQLMIYVVSGNSDYLAPRLADALVPDQ